jgi:hypothetical protein
MRALKTSLKKVEDELKVKVQKYDRLVELLSAFVPSVSLNNINWSELTILDHVPLKTGVVYRFEISCFSSSHVFDRLVTNAGIMVVKKYAASNPRSC